MAAVRLEREGALARVTLSNPGRLNAMSRAMWGEMARVFRALQEDAAIRCVLLAGEGDAFCAGGDISEYAGFRFDESTLRDFHEREVWGGLSAVLDCDIPVVACIRGACMGAGVEIASACDIRLAADTARFGAPIARLGFPMAPREAALVGRAVGDATAREFLLEAAVLGAPEMHRRGFLHDVVAEAALQARTEASIGRILAGAPQAARLNKRTLRALQPDGLGPDSAYAYAPTAEHREGIAAFLDKRKPAF